MSLDSSVFFAGDLVKVRSQAEILSTLDQDGRLENVPFMPEMLRYCGRQFRVYKRAHKTCDFVNKTGIRSLPNTVHLEGLRCDGAAHGGCQAQCLLFWKDAWLKRPDEPKLPVPVGAGCTELELWSATRVDYSVASNGHSLNAAAARPVDPLRVAAAASCPAANGTNGHGAVAVLPPSNHQRPAVEPVYSCQATLVPDFTRALSPWNIRAYAEDYRSGNVPAFGQFLRRFAYRMYDHAINLGVGLGKPLRGLYDFANKLIGGGPYPGHTGRVAPGQKTPAVSLNLQPGELVRVKDLHAILASVDQSGKNRGMAFSAEMALYCGRTFRVLSRVNRLIDEKSGRMLRMKSECIILEGVICTARYHKKLIFCPRATYPYWREIWLERVEAPAVAAPVENCDPGTSECHVAPGCTA